MGYAEALRKAWDEAANLGGDVSSVKFLADTYDVDPKSKTVFSSSCNIPAKEQVSIIVLHYLIKRLKLKTLPEPTGKWISFNELEGGDGYYPAFKKRTIDVVLRKFKDNPEALLDLVGRFSAKRAQAGDFSVVIEPFEGAPVLIAIWKGDEEFGPEANIHFDASISKIFCTEDIVILTEFLTHAL